LQQFGGALGRRDDLRRKVGRAVDELVGRDAVGQSLATHYGGVGAADVPAAHAELDRLAVERDRRRLRGVQSPNQVAHNLAVSCACRHNLQPPVHQFVLASVAGHLEQVALRKPFASGARRRCRHRPHRLQYTPRRQESLPARRIRPVMPEPALKDVLHALLFVADAPLSLQTLCEATGEPAEAVEAALHALQRELTARGAVQLVALAGGYQLATKPEYAFYIARLLNPPQKRLSRAALETLAIIAYEQPVTQAQIDALRGVDSSHTVRQLLARGLIQEVGRKDAPGKPALYGVTPQFLHYFGLNSLEELPERPEGE
jgi:segregation and condensation protein B